MSKVHIAGALLFFVTGVTYIILQSIISYRAFPFGSSISVCRVRLAFAVVAAVAFLPCILSFYPLTLPKESVLCVFLLIIIFP